MLKLKNFFRWMFGKEKIEVAEEPETMALPLFSKKPRKEKGFFGERDLEVGYYLWTEFEVIGDRYEVFNQKIKSRSTLEELVKNKSPDFVYEVDEPFFFLYRKLLYRRNPTSEPPFDSNR